METPLFMACETGNLDCVNVICKEKGVMLDHQDKFGDSALHFAAREGQLEICDYLLRKGAKLAQIKN